jgi:hypothetical protein
MPACHQVEAPSFLAVLIFFLFSSNKVLLKKKKKNVH